MNANKTIARIVGVLFIIGTAAGVLSVMLTGSVLNDTEYLTEVAANDGQIIFGALCVLTMGFSLALIPVVIFPVIKRYNETLAVGYVVFRGALETVTYFVLFISWLLLVILCQEYVKAGALDTSHFDTMGTLLKETGEFAATLTAIVFPLGALMLYTVLYQSRLIPRWLSVWGLIGVILHLVFTGLAGALALTSDLSTIQEILNFPIFLQEMVMAVWLIVKGFDPSVIAAVPARTDINQA